MGFGPILPPLGQVNPFADDDLQPLRLTVANYVALFGRQDQGSIYQEAGGCLQKSWRLLSPVAQDKLRDADFPGSGKRFAQQGVSFAGTLICAASGEGLLALSLFYLLRRPSWQARGEFNEKHPDIQYDLAHPHEPRCSFGYLLEALDRRRIRGLPLVTLMSCDNIQSNGEVAKKMLTAFAELRDPVFRNWLTENCVFPNSMVDRITPATTDEHRNLVKEKFGIDDGWPVMTESFKQWVIEDHFVQGRPAWELVGAQMTTDVLPYEKMKLRLLNASHQALCYIGMLLGYQLVHETMADRDIQTLVEKMMDHEVTPLLSEVPGVDLTEYKKTLIERFANPAIRDQLSRIGIYGSSGIPKFVLPSIEEQLQRRGPIKLLSFTVASWFRFLGGLDESGKEMPMLDPLAPTLRQRAKAAGRDARQLLAMREIFSEELANSPAFVKEVSDTLQSFYEKGARSTLVNSIA